jgi:hypothetical protein
LIFHDIKEGDEEVYLLEDVPHQVLCFQVDQKELLLELFQLVFKRDKSFYLGIWLEKGLGEITLKSQIGR